MKEITKKEEKLKSIIIGIVLILTIALFWMVYYNYSTVSVKQIPSAELIQITCDQCFDLGGISNSLENNGAKIENKKILDYNSKEAQQIIAKYSLTKVPAIVLISKNIDKINIDKSIFNIGKDYAVFDRGVPFVELSSNKLQGLVKMKLLSDSECKECVSLSGFKSQLEKEGVKFSDYEEINSSSQADLIKSYNVEFLPTLVISKNIEGYWWFFDKLKPLLKDSGENYFLKTPIPPYKELSTNKIKGVVDVTYLTNKSCSDCLNISSVGAKFKQAGIYIGKENYFDISSVRGKNFISMYNLTIIPTLILSKDLSDYQQLVNSLKSIGTFEKDGSFVLRKLDSFGKYQELLTKGGDVSSS